MKKKEKHEHIWKYEGSFVRTCEAPIPTIDSCGKEEWKTINGWADSEEVIRARNEDF